MASPFPTQQYLVAFFNSQNDDPALITTIATPPGTVGLANVWTDITPWVEQSTMRRGRQHELDRFEAGECTLDLNNNDGRFSPWNASSPYFGFLVPGAPVQLRATWNAVTYTRWTGAVQSWPIQWPDGTSAWAQMTAVDQFRNFNLANITNSTLYSAAVLASGPDAYYRLSDAIGSVTAADSSGNGYTGSYYGTVTLGVDGSSLVNTNTAVEFVNGGGSVTTGAGVTALSSTSDYTIEAWFKTTEDDASLHYIVSGPGALYYDNGQIYGASGTLIATIFSPVSVVVNDGEWHHAVYVLASTDAYLYIDGVQVATASAVSTSTGTALTYIGSDAAHSNGFTGTLDEIALYPGPLSAATVLVHYNAGSAGAIEQLPGARINAILDVVGWPAGARIVESGTTMIQANTQNLTQTKAMSHMQTVEQTESGALYMGRAGQVAFVARNSFFTTTQYSTVQATFGDTLGGAEIPFEPDPDLAMDDIDIWNEITVQRLGGAIQTSAQHLSSQVFYGRRTYALTDQLHTTDIDALYHAQFLDAKYYTPLTRLRAIHVDLLDFLGSTTMVAAVLSLSLLYRVEVKRHPPGGGTIFDQIALIEHIEETVTPYSWRYTFALSPTDAIEAWILNDTTYSVLDSTTIPAW